MALEWSIVWQRPAFLSERRTLQRQTVIASNSNLQERESLKHATLIAATAEGLRHRGVAKTVATLAAEVGSLAFRGALSRWADSACKKQFAKLAREAREELRAATAALA